MEPADAKSQSDDQQPAHIKRQLSITQLEYMQDRVIYKMRLYEKLAHDQKRRYLATSLASIILAPTVPVLINLGVPPIYPTILSLLVTILVSVEKLFHFREHWRNYDEIAAFLRREQLQFQTGAGEYQDGDKAFHCFVTRIERAIGDERTETIGMRTQENSAR